ncbi:MAG: acetylglutamate kinase [Defluviitaleaceae bacterium]|nr:acetylglutamate kinase [Defluviitaleaceae bacterium]
MKNFERASVLSEALPYIRAFSKKTVVVKYDNNAMQTEELKRAAISDIVLLSLVGVRVVVVHGDGSEINSALKSMGNEPKFINDLRYTDEVTMNLVQMLLTGKIGKDIVSLISSEGGKAFGFSGLDGSSITAEKLKGDVDYGLIGEIKTINTELINVALDNGYIPVISTIAEGIDANTSYNLNADTTAAELAVSLGAEKLILLTDKCGICSDARDESSLISELPLSQVRPLIKKGVISGEMIRKVDCCAKAVRRGVSRAHILDGRLSHSILVEMLTDSGIGTMILAD